jgi:hypothetical protein
MTPDERDKRDRSDIQFLVQRAEFARFLFRVIQTARIFETATDGSNDEAAAALARRNLGLEILAMVEAGQPVPHPDGLPILTVLQALREEANPPPQEKPSGRRNQDRYDRNSDLSDGDGADE